MGWKGGGRRTWVQVLAGMELLPMKFVIRTLGPSDCAAFVDGSYMKKNHKNKRTIFIGSVSNNKKIKKERKRIHSKGEINKLTSSGTSIYPELNS
jgi:hypothetical protein